MVKLNKIDLKHLSNLRTYRVGGDNSIVAFTQRDIRDAYNQGIDDLYHGAKIATNFPPKPLKRKDIK